MLFYEYNAILNKYYNIKMFEQKRNIDNKKNLIFS